MEDDYRSVLFLFELQIREFRLQEFYLLLNSWGQFSSQALTTPACALASGRNSDLVVGALFLRL